MLRMTRIRGTVQFLLLGTRFPPVGPIEYEDLRRMRKSVFAPKMSPQFSQ
jgi:hypothetical protein